MNPFKNRTKFKKIVEYMIHVVLISVADIKNISNNALDLHTQGKVMPDKYIHIDDARSKNTGCNCFVIRTMQDLVVGGRYYAEARKEQRVRKAAELTKRAKNLGLNNLR